MANYHLSSTRAETALPVDLSGLFHAAQRISAWLLRELSAWNTRRVLTSLPPEMLEDIGVPHVGVSLRAGTLDRYPEIIEPQSRS